MRSNQIISALCSQWWAVVACIASVFTVTLVIFLISAPPVRMLDAAVRGYEVIPSPSSYREAALYYEVADPVADARRAVDAGDQRLWAIGEGDPSIPGVEPALNDWYARTFKLRVMYLSDDSLSEDEVRFETALFRYAELYNKTVDQLRGR